MRTVFCLLLLCCLLGACGVSRKIHQSAQNIVLQDPALQTAHVGISIYEPATGRWWYNFQGDKYFVPASNVKIATCYAAMKYLGDSLVGLRFSKNENGYLLQATGDPTFLDPEFRRQPVYDFLKKNAEVGELTFATDNWQARHLGSGWSWNDYNASYMVERSPFPVYGNLVQFSFRKTGLVTSPAAFEKLLVFEPGIEAFDSISIERELAQNNFFIRPAKTIFGSEEIPFVTNGFASALLLLNDTIRPKLPFNEVRQSFPAQGTRLHSQPTDSLLKPMMHRSDNFFAEQSLLMVSNEVLGYMNDEKIIDTLLKTDFAALPHRPRWADGSGLSRYNLFTPQDFVFILQKIKDEFGMERIRILLPSGGEGTLSGFYKGEKPFLYAKTGTLSGVVALSGYLTTKKGKELIVSVLVNNHRSGAVQIRRLIEQFLQNLRDMH
jgi:D-alanyl-D-alanine carboxypeptidase/D-alanyl-D-alanine-endopeptidase (penicillin-binding protein 4)